MAVQVLKWVHVDVRTSYPLKSIDQFDAKPAELSRRRLLRPFAIERDIAVVIFDDVRRTDWIRLEPGYACRRNALFSSVE